MNLKEAIRRIIKEEVAELEQNSVKDSLQQMIDDEGVMFAAQFVGGVDNLVNLIYGGDLKSFYKENNLSPYKYSDSGMDMYIDDFLVHHMASPLEHTKKEKSLGKFSFGSKNGGKYRFDAKVEGPKRGTLDQLWWRVIGTSGDSGFGYSFITTKNTLGKRYRQQIFQQIIDKYNLNQYMWWNILLNN